MIKLVTFCDAGVTKFEETALAQSCSQHSWTSIVLKSEGNWTRNAIKLKLLKEYLLANTKREETLLCTDAFDVILLADPQCVEAEFEKFSTDILFSAEANYYFRSKALKYFYWKHYPRSSAPYDFVNSGTIVGKANAILMMLESMEKAYALDFNNEEQLREIRSDQYLFSRFYCDVQMGVVPFEPRLKLDKDQRLLANSGGRMYCVPRELRGKIEKYLYFNYERRLLKTFSLERFQDLSLNLHFKNDQLRNSETGTHPLVLHLPASRENFKTILEGMIKGKSPQKSFKRSIAQMISMLAFMQFKVAMFIIRYRNCGELNPTRIFRYAPNRGTGMQEGIQLILEKLENRKPLVFSHFNDGEMRFIASFLKGEKNNYEFGRRQNQYNERLGSRLHTAFLHQSTNYYVGVPCGTCHPEYRHLANQLRDDGGNFLPALVIHHNLNFLPRLLAALKGRRIYRVMNDGQDDQLLRELGLQIDPVDCLVVPFRNSYHLFEKLIEKKFAENAVVLLTCGMLGKLLAYEWHKANPTVTFLTIGSALDDLIQKKYMRFRLFPKDFPVTRNLHPSRYFLFGYKRHCPECFDLVESEAIETP